MSGFYAVADSSGVIVRWGECSTPEIIAAQASESGEIAAPFDLAQQASMRDAAGRGDPAPYRINPETGSVEVTT